jgi:hypothetical protein
MRKLARLSLKLVSLKPDVPAQPVELTYLEILGAVLSTKATLIRAGRGLLSRDHRPSAASPSLRIAPVHVAQHLTLRHDRWTKLGEARSRPKHHAHSGKRRSNVTSVKHAFTSCRHQAGYLASFTIFCRSGA